MRPPVPGVGTTVTSTPTRAIAASGRAMSMLDRQPRTCVSVPPRTRPTPDELPMMVPQMPNALARSAGVVNDVPSRASAAGA